MKKLQNKQKKESTLNSVNEQAATDMVGGQANESKFKRVYRRIPVLMNILCIIVFGVVIVLMVYYGLRWGTRHNKAIKVPAFIEMSLEDARKLADEMDLELVVRDSVYETDIAGGLVVDQMPAPSTVRDVTVKPDRKIYLTVNAYARRKVKVPYVGHVALRQAINQLEREGFNIKELTFVQHHADIVTSQSVGGRTITRTSDILMPYGSGVNLTVGYRNGHHITSVPRLIGMRLHQAQNALWTSGLNVNKIEYDSTVTDLKSRRIARVYMQTQPSKKGVKRGTKVSLYLTCDDKLIDSLSKISDHNAKYLDEQRKLMEQEAQEEARLQEEREAKRREEEERRAAEAAELLESIEAVDGSTQIYGSEEEAKAVAEATAAQQTAQQATSTTDEDEFF